MYPDIDLKAARCKTAEVRELLAAGVDPGENRRARRAAEDALAANSFEVVTREWLTRQRNTWVPDHGNRIVARLKRDFFPWLGESHQ